MSLYCPAQSVAYITLTRCLASPNNPQAEQPPHKPWQERALAGVLGAAAAASIVCAGPAEAAVQPFLSSTGKPCTTVAFCCRHAVCTHRMPGAGMWLSGLSCRSKRYHCRGGGQACEAAARDRRRGKGGAAASSRELGSRGPQLSKREAVCHTLWH